MAKLDRLVSKVFRPRSSRSTNTSTPAVQPAINLGPVVQSAPTSPPTVQPTAPSISTTQPANTSTSTAQPATTPAQTVEPGRISTPSVQPATTPALTGGPITTSTSSVPSTTTTIDTQSTIPNSGTAPPGTQPNIAQARPHRNLALETALQKYVDDLPDTQKDAFRDASQTFDEINILAQVRQYDDEHSVSSAFRPQAERLSKFLHFLDRFMGGVAIGIQANPDLSAIIVGGIRVVIDLAISFVEFFRKLTDMLYQIEEYLELLAALAHACQDSALVTKALVAVYADVVDFCHQARLAFVKSDGMKLRFVSFRVFLRNQWEPFEATFGTIKANLQHHVDMLRMTGQVQQLVNHQTREREDLLTWISSHDYEGDHDTIFAKKHSCTGDWLLRCRDFRDWENSPSSGLLWCHGNPGAGKSVLASNALDHLSARALQEPNTAVCFVYYNYRNVGHQSPLEIACALLKQMCRHSETMLPDLLKFKQDARRPSFSDVQSFLVKAARQMQLEHLYIVIDALDECLEDQRPDVIGLVRFLLTDLSGAKIFITSRKEPDIDRAFKELQTPTIQIQVDDTVEDIRTYVDNEVRSLRKGVNGKKLFIQEDSLQDEIVSTLIERADGMFLWVKFQLDSLCKISQSRRDDHVRTALHRLPQGLDEAYRRILQQIENQDTYMQTLAKTTLMWILYQKSRRKMKLKCLQTAVAASRALKTNSIPKLDSTEVILEACGNLIVLGPKNMPQLIHYSVQEFFQTNQSNSPLGGLEGELRDVEVLQSILAGTCVSRLLEIVAEACTIRSTLDDSRTPLGMKYTDFDRYAVYHFDDHAASAGILSGETIHLIDRLLQSTDDQMNEVIGYWLSRGINLLNIVSPIAISVFIYMTRLFDAGRTNKRWLDASPPRFALGHAANAGLESAVRHLIALGVDVNEKNLHDVTPLTAAAESGKFDIATLLLDHGAIPDTIGGAHKTAIQAASANGYIDIVRLLLERKANVNIPGGMYGSALRAAADEGHLDIVKLLIENGAVVNMEGCRSESALSAASLHDRTLIVKILIENGAKVNSSMSKGCPALKLAAAEGGHNTVELLIDNGARMKEEDEVENLLAIAINRGHDHVLQTLLVRGADVWLQEDLDAALHLTHERRKRRLRDWRTFLQDKQFYEDLYDRMSGMLRAAGARELASSAVFWIPV